MTSGKRYPGGDVVEYLRHLEDRLDVIETALSVARDEPEPEHRGRLLDVLDRATATVRAEHEEAETVQEKRSSFRLVRCALPYQAQHPERANAADAAPDERWRDRSPDPAARSAG